MTPFSTYEFYCDKYKGKLNKDCYDTAVVKANRKVLSSINGRNIPEEMKENVMLCECELTDVMYEFSQMPKGVSSVNNDGYSVAYGGSKSENDVCKEVCTMYLQYPVNLMCRWV